MIQSFYLEHDSMACFLKIIRSIIETMFNEKGGDYSQLYITTKQSFLDFKDEKKKLFICSISDYKPDMEKDDLAVPFNSFDHLMGRLWLLIKDDPNQKISNEKRFRQHCGNGYTYSFNEGDGDTGMGYCARYRPNGAWNNLDIFFCHMYYGK